MFVVKGVWLLRQLCGCGVCLEYVVAGVVNCGGSFMVVVKGVLLLLQVYGCGGSCMVVVKGVWLLRKFLWLL